jgi:hypothetical protein
MATLLREQRVAIGFLQERSEFEILQTIRGRPFVPELTTSGS